jgi:pre-mRNA-processing factor 8
MDYSLRLDTPQNFYAECHRPQHFIQMEEAEELENADLDDFLE